MKHNKARTKMIAKIYSCTALILIFVAIASVSLVACSSNNSNSVEEVTEIPSVESFYPNTEPQLVPDTTSPETVEPDVVETPDQEVPEPPVETEQVEPEPTIIFLGDFTITYYCSCEKCCGKWAQNRPVVDGKEIVYTASGEIAEDGVTIAVDTDVIPFGTTVYIEGVGYRTAQDTGSSIKGNHIDVYMDSHEAAKQAGIHTAQVYIVNAD